MKSKTVYLLVIILTLPFLGGVPGILLQTHANSPTVINSLPYTITTPGTYIINTDLSTTGDAIIVATGNVTIIGNGHTITGSGTGTGIIIESAPNVTIQDLNIERFHYGIKATNITHPNYAMTGPIIRNVTVQDTSTGIYIYNIDYPGGVLLEDVRIQNSASYGVSSYYAYDIIIKNSVIEGSNSVDTGMYIYYTWSIYMYNTTITGTGENGLELNSSGYASIISSEISNNTGYGILMNDSYWVLLLNNEISYNNMAGILSNQTALAYIVSCNIIHNYGNGTNIIQSYDIYINNSMIAYNSQTGIYVDVASQDNVFYANQILYNSMYGVYAQQMYPNLNITYNVFWHNGVSPQAYDENAVGGWENNYWSDLNGTTYTFYNNTDPSPLAEPLYDLVITKAYLPPGTIYSPTQAYVTISNPTPGYATNVPVTLLAGKIPEFKKIPFTWINVDPLTATSTTYSSVIEDYGNYTISGDDVFFVYKLPWPANILGQEYQYISVTSNGYIEFLKTNESALWADYAVYTYSEHRLVYNPNETYGIGVTTLFAYSADLYAMNYVGVFNYGDKLVIAFNGTTYGDQNTTTAPINYEIILYNNGTIVISLGEIKYNTLYGEGFAGLYFQPLGLEIPVGYMVPPYTSYKLDPSTENISTTNVTLRPFSNTTIGLQVNPDNIGSNGPAGFWLKIADPIIESDPYNNYFGPLSAPVAIVGGVLVPPTASNSYYTIVAVAIITGTLALSIILRRTTGSK